MNRKEGTANVRMPGFSADAILQPRHTIARDITVDDGQGGTITIEGNCHCVERKQICLSGGGWCFLGVCVPEIKLCFDWCTRIRCTPS